MELKRPYFPTALPNFKGLNIFTDNYDILRMLSAFNATCQPIDWDYIVANLDRSKLVIPVTHTKKALGNIA